MLSEIKEDKEQDIFTRLHQNKQSLNEDIGNQDLALILPPISQTPQPKKPKVVRKMDIGQKLYRN
jgi:hypothetical protein